MDQIQRIIDESLRDGKGVILHIDNFNWLIQQAEKLQKIKKSWAEIEDSIVLDVLFGETED